MFDLIYCVEHWDKLTVSLLLFYGLVFYWIFKIHNLQ